MTMRKITLTLPDELIAAAEAAVTRGRARSVSAYVAAAAGAGEARLSLAEVMDRWATEAGDTERTDEAQAWAQAFMARHDQAAAARTGDGQAA